MPLNRGSSEGVNDEHLSQASIESLLAEVMRRVNQARGRETEIGKAKPQASLGWALDLGEALGISAEELLLISARFTHLAEPLTNAHQIRSLKENAEKADLRDQIPQALTLYLRCLAASPEDHWVRLRLARLMIDRGETEAAEAIYLRGKASSDHPILMAINVELSLSRSEFKKAHREAISAMELAPDDVEVLLSAARACHWSGHLEEELKILTKVYTLDPRHPLVIAQWCDRADPSLSPQRRLQDIERHLGRMHQSPPRAVHLAWINALLINHQFERALTEARSLLERHTQSLSARIALASALFHAGKVDEAYAHVEEALRVNPHSATALAIALACLTNLSSSRDQLDEVLRSLEERSEGSPKVELWLAQFLEASGDTQRAFIRRDQCLQLHPNYFPAKLAMADQLLRMGLQDEGDRLVDQLIVLKPHSLEARLLLAERSLRAGSWDEFDELLDRCRDTPAVHELKLRGLLARGEYEAARVLAVDLCTQNPSNSILLEYLINALWQSEAQIESHLNRLMLELPIVVKRGHILVLLSYLWFHLDDEDQAITLLRELIEANRVSELAQPRLMMACEIAHRTHQSDLLSALVSEGQKRSLLHPSFVFYELVIEWIKGGYEQALERALACLESGAEWRADQLIVVVIWACELKRYQVANSLLASLRHSQDVSAVDLEVLSLRVGLNLDDREMLENVGDTAWKWLTEQGNIQACSLLIEWCIEQHIEPKQTTQLGPFESLSVKGDEELEDIRLSLALEYALWGAERFSEDVELWRQLSFIYQLRDDIQAAIYAQERVVEAHPRAIDWVGLGHLYELSRDDHRAHEAFLKGVQLIKEGADQHIVLLEWACHCARSGDENKTTEAFEQIIEHMKGEGVSLDDELNSDKKSSGIREVLKTWLTHALHHCSPDYLFSIATELLGNYEVPEINGFIGLAELQVGRFAEALPLLEAGYKADPQFGHEFGRCLWLQGERSEAIKIMIQCVAQYPEELEIRLDLIEMLIDEKEGELAYDHLLNVMTNHPAYDELDELCSRVYEFISYH